MQSRSALINLVKSLVASKQHRGLAMRTQKVPFIRSVYAARNYCLQVVEGIIDSGRTMSQVLSILDNVGVREKWTAVLLSKRTKRAVKVNPLILHYSNLRK